jgi:plastocyanin
MVCPTMRGRRRGRERATIRRARRTLTALATVIGALAVVPSGASAVEQEFTYRIPITVSGYEVKQTVVNGPRPAIDGHITHMEANIVAAASANAPTSTPVPISRLMLHHIVFLNTGREDQSCDINDGILSFDSMTRVPAVERFFAAGEERAKMAMPPGYGYEMGPAATNRWAVLYMVMNHKADLDSAFIEYKVTVEDGEAEPGEDPPQIQSAVPFWLDAENCSADPIYNIPGTGDDGSTDVQSRDFIVDQSKLGAAGGRIVAGAGHVHGGAERLEITQPTCGDRELARSIPTWGRKDHEFYNVRPILHEPGPINMTAFETPTGFPIRAGQPLRLNSVYDNTRPHTRVMGIFIVYIAPDASVPADPCTAEMPEPLPNGDLKISERPDGRTKGPVKFKVPLTGLDENGQAIKIAKPPGETKEMKSGSTIEVRDNLFTRPNVKIHDGDELNWAFDSAGLHNLTLANGPEAIGSPNLSKDGAGDPRVFSKRFKRSGTYRMFCALHPVQMSERVVVKP